MEYGGKEEEDTEMENKIRNIKQRKREENNRRENKKTQESKKKQR